VSTSSLPNRGPSPFADLNLSSASVPCIWRISDILCVPVSCSLRISSCIFCASSERLSGISSPSGKSLVSAAASAGFTGPYSSSASLSPSGYRSSREISFRSDASLVRLYRDRLNFMSSGGVLDTWDFGVSRHSWTSHYIFA